MLFIPFVTNTHAPVGQARTRDNNDNMPWRFVTHGALPPRHLDTPPRIHRNTVRAPTMSAEVETEARQLTLVTRPAAKVLY